MEDKDIKITAEFLEKNKFEKNERFEGQLIEYVSPDGQVTFMELSNMADRDWYVHVDNDHFETVGSLDVANLDQVKKFFELCEYKYEWSV